jgi:hypothetical protein
LAGTEQARRHVLLEQQRPPVQHVRHGLEQHEDRDQRGQVGPGRGGHPVADALQAHPAEDVVDGERAQHRQHDDGEADAEQVAPQRIVEDVEPEVHVELRVLDAELLRVLEEHPVLPPALGGEPGEEADDQGEHGDPGAESRRDDHPVALEGLLLRGVRAQQRAQPVRQIEVGRDDQRDRESDDQEKE